MRIIATLLALTACASDPTSNLNAEIGWSFNYRDWTKPNCADTGLTCPQPPSAGCRCDDLRGCTNEAAGGAAGYDDVASVEILLDDPAGQLPLYQESFPCDRGTAEVKGMVQQIYKLEVTAKNAAGLVMYREKNSSFDLTTLRAETVELRAAVGELNFFPAFSDTGQTCPTGIEDIRWTVFVGGTETVVATGEAPACDASHYVNELILRNIPSFPEPDESGVSMPIAYDVRLEAIDAGRAVAYCSVEARTVFPGNTNFRNNQVLTPGSCL